MSAPELFGVVVRAIGFYYVVGGIYGALGALTPSAGFGPADYIKPALVEFGLGFIVMALAVPIAMLAYRTYAKDDSESDDGPGVWTGPLPADSHPADSN